MIACGRQNASLIDLLKTVPCPALLLRQDPNYTTIPVYFCQATDLEFPIYVNVHTTVYFFTSAKLCNIQN